MTEPIDVIPEAPAHGARVNTLGCALPCTIFPTRYEDSARGTYWLALPLAPRDVPAAATADGWDNIQWFCDYTGARKPIGMGLTANEAHHSLMRQLTPKDERDKFKKDPYARTCESCKFHDEDGFCKRVKIIDDAPVWDALRAVVAAGDLSDAWPAMIDAIVKADFALSDVQAADGVLRMKPPAGFGCELHQVDVEKWFEHLYRNWVPALEPED